MNRVLVLFMITGGLSAQPAERSYCPAINAVFGGFIQCGSCPNSHNIDTADPILIDLDGDGNLDLAALVCPSPKAAGFDGSYCIGKPVPNHPNFDPEAYMHCGEEARQFLRRSSKTSNFLAICFGKSRGVFEASERKVLLNGGWTLARVSMQVFAGKVRDWPGLGDSVEIVRAPKITTKALYLADPEQTFSTIIYWNGRHFQWHPVDPQPPRKPGRLR